MDDHLGDTTTTSILIPNGPAVAGVLETGSDKDWFRMTWSRHLRYRFFFTVTPADSGAAVVAEFFGADGIRYVAGTAVSFFPDGFPIGDNIAGTHFLEMDQVSTVGFPAGGLAYTVRAEIVDEEETDEYFFPQIWNADWSSRIHGTINVPGDTDRGLIRLLAGVEYGIEILGRDSGGGTTLSDPMLSLYLVNPDDPGQRTLVATDDDSGTGTNALIRYTPSETGIYEMAVSGKANSTGAWTLDPLVVDDAGATPATASGLILLTATETVVSGVAEIWGAAGGIGGDIDTRRLRVEAGRTWYFHLPDDGRGEIALTRATGNWLRQAAQPPYSSLNGFAWTAESNETLFLVHRAGDTAIASGTAPPPDYRIEIEQVATVALTPEYGVVLPFGDSPILDGRLGLDDRFYSSVDLFSTVSLQSRRFQDPAISFSPNTLYSDQRFSLEHDLRVDPFIGAAEIFIRAKGQGATPSGTPPLPFETWTNWTSLPVSGMRLPDIHEVQHASKVQPNEVTFAFADALPGYHSGSSLLNGFSALSSAERTAMRMAIGAWDQGLGHSFREVTSHQDLGAVNIVIFKSSITSPSLTWYPDAQAGGDIVLNEDADFYSDLSPGSRGYFELLRGVGRALGLAHVSYMHRESTIMGLVQSPTLNSSVFPSTPLPYDLFRAREVYGTDSATAVGDTNWSLSGWPFVRTIVDASGYDTIDARLQTLGANIDLRPGMVSFDGRDYSRARQNTFYVALDSIIERAIGSPGNDWLSGNHLANRLVGNSGADVLLGRQGDDVLLGDSGDDIYHYRFGDGHDRIEDRGLASDRDVLRIEGFGDFRNLENDRSFSRLGNELLIEIEPGTVMGGMAGSIRIDMTSRASGVEILTLANASTVFQSVSLRSIFNQATADPARFRATGQGSSDTFLATPFFS